MGTTLERFLGFFALLSALILVVILASGTDRSARAGEPLAAAAPTEEAPGLLPEPVPLAKCDFCSTAPFNPRFGIVCTFAGDCRPGANGCCEYTCTCGEDTGNFTVPANACTLDLPTNCCPGGKRFCPVSYCLFDGVRCVASGCQVGCCTYQCGADPTCLDSEPPPPEAC